MNDRDYRRERVLDEAIASGKFPETRRQHYRDTWELDPPGTEKLIASLEGIPILASIPPAQPEANLAAARDLFPELRNPRPLRHGGGPQVQGQPRSGARPTAAPAAPVHSSHSPAAEPQTPQTVGLTPETVSAWTEQLFPETAARNANSPNPQIMHADD